MIEEYSIHNQFRIGLEEFIERDPQLQGLQGVKYIHPMDWWREIDWNEPGIYILRGGRQIGKTTSTKLLIKEMLQNGAFIPLDGVIDGIPAIPLPRFLTTDISRLQ